MTFKGVGVAIALMAGLGVVVNSQPASAQNILVDLATASLDTILNRSANNRNNNRQFPPQPVPNSNYTFGTGNMNGNNINFCVFPCLPNGGSPAASRIAPTIPPGVVPNRGIPSPQPNRLPPGVIPNRGIPTQPVGVAPGVVPNRGIPSPQPNRLPPGAIPNRGIPSPQPNRVPPGVVPNRNVPPQQNRPQQNSSRRPTIIIPPITLPFSL